MSVTRLNHFTARDGQSDALIAVLVAALPSIRKSAGCISCELLQSQANANQIVVLEIWDNVESHQAAVKAIPEEAFAGVMDLLEGMPSGEYYTQIDQQRDRHD